MKKTLLILLALFISFGAITIISSCKKEEEEPKEIPPVIPPDAKFFSVQIENEKFYEEGWVILHNLDGTEVDTVVKFDETFFADFGVVDGDSVTATIITVYNNDTKQPFSQYDVNIRSFMEVPGGEWYIQGKSIVQSNNELGVAVVNLTYPPANGFECEVFATDGYFKSTNMPPNGKEIELEVYRLDEGNTYSIYGYVRKTSQKYSGWLLDVPFTIGTNNMYEMDMSASFIEHDITTNVPIDRITLYNYRNNRNSYFRLHNEYYTTPETEHIVYYCDTMPISDYRLLVSELEEDYSFFMYNYYDSISGVPSDVSIPEHTIIGDYSVISDTIKNITLTGSASFIYGKWRFYDQNVDKVVVFNWDVRVENNVTEIVRPALPQDIIDALGQENFDEMEAHSLGLNEYNTVSNFRETINLFYKDQETEFNYKYDDLYSYTYYFNLDKSNQKIEKRMERSQMAF